MKKEHMGLFTKEDVKACQIKEEKATQDAGVIRKLVGGTLIIIGSTGLAASSAAA